MRMSKIVGIATVAAASAVAVASSASAEPAPSGDVTVYINDAHLTAVHDGDDVTVTAIADEGMLCFAPLLYEGEMTADVPAEFDPEHPFDGYNLENMKMVTNADLGALAGEVTAVASPYDAEFAGLGTSARYTAISECVAVEDYLAAGDQGAENMPMDVYIRTINYSAEGTDPDDPGAEPGDDNAGAAGSLGSLTGSLGSLGGR